METTAIVASVVRKVVFRAKDYVLLALVSGQPGAVRLSLVVQPAGVFDGHGSSPTANADGSPLLSMAGVTAMQLSEFAEFLKCLSQVAALTCTDELQELQSREAPEQPIADVPRRFDGTPAVMSCTSDP
jgi:hypothetical protein